MGRLFLGLALWAVWWGVAGAASWTTAETCVAAGYRANDPACVAVLRGSDILQQNAAPMPDDAFMTSRSGEAPGRPPIETPSALPPLPAPSTTVPSPPFVGPMPH